MGFRLTSINGRATLVVDDQLHDLYDASGGDLPQDPMAALAMPDELGVLTERLRTSPGDQAGGSLSGALENGIIDPPVPRPRNCYGVGLNYRSHAAEGGMDVPENPLVFTKFPSCLTGPTGEVRLRSDGCDYEGELVVVIGRGGSDIDPAAAWDHVVGVTVGQDISDRPAQFSAKPPHFDLGKSFDTFGPIGPVVVSVDELADRDAIRIITEINGEVRQDDTTANLIFDVPTLLSYLSRITTLATGDLIFTGTPEGVGAAKGQFLADGDVITTTIDGIGTMTNRCRRVSDWR